MNKIFITACAFLLAINVNGQVKIDRTKQPDAGPAPVISIGTPVSYKLSNGITVLVVEDHHLPKVTATYFIDQGPITEGAKAGAFDMMGSMLSEGTTTKTKAQFDEAVDQIGADVEISGSRSVASALTRYFSQAFMLMADALQHPSFPQASFEKLQSQAITGLKSNEKSAKAISARVVNALAFGPTHPNGEFETEESINALTLDDIKKAYKDYVTPSRGYLTFVGDIKPLEAKALAEKAFAKWQGTQLSLPKLAEVSNPAKTEVDLVDVPNAVQSEITVENLVDLPMSSPDYFAALLTNQILGGGEEGHLNKNLREKHGYTYGSFSSIGADRFQTKFYAIASVRNEKTDSAVMEIMKELDTIRTQKVSDDELASAKALYNGAFALGLENPARTAGFATNILIHNLPEDFYKTYLQKINAVTAEDVQRVAQKYFNYGNTRIVIVGKAEAVKPGLTAMGYPVNMYDKYAKEVQATAAGMKSDKTPSEIIDNYIKAIGGEAAVKNVNSFAVSGKMSMQGMSLGYEKKQMSPNMEMTEVTMNGNAVVHTYFDGKTGSAVQMGNKQDLSKDELMLGIEKKGIFPQLFYKEDGYKLEDAGIEKVGGNDAYKINITSPASLKSTEYYDVNNGYLVKTVRNTNEAGQDVTQTLEYSNYKKAGNVMVPFTYNFSVETPNGTQEFTVEVEDVKVNSGVAKEDFK